jgi:hypothetical protein
MDAPIRKGGMYVPTSRRPKTVTRAPLPRELAAAPAGNTFRTTRWSGEPEPVIAPLPVASAPLSPGEAAAAVFARVSWSGAPAEAAPLNPSPRSVERVLGSIRWE